MFPGIQFLFRPEIQLTSTPMAQCSISVLICETFCAYNSVDTFCASNPDAIAAALQRNMKMRHEFLTLQQGNNIIS
jgi:hypothetical protein